MNKVLMPDKSSITELIVLMQVYLFHAYLIAAPATIWSIRGYRIK